jgi:hypothetical protein
MREHLQAKAWANQQPDMEHRLQLGDRPLAIGQN